MAVAGTQADSATASTDVPTVDTSRSRFLPVPKRDQFHTYVVHFIAGRTDGSTPRAGAFQVWADGVDKPVINLRNIDTVQRADGVTQKWMQLWEGDYTRALPQIARQSFALTRIGRTLAEALADRPTSVGTTAEGQFYTGSGEDLGPPSAKKLPARTADAALIPSSLGGNTSPPDPIETWEITLTPNYVSPADGVASNYQSVWIYPKSPTTPYRSPDSEHQQSRYLLLDPGATDSDGRIGRDEWWFVIERNWPSDFNQYEHGAWGFLVNFHNVAGDVGWNTGSPVSALALTWGRTPAPSFALEYQKIVPSKKKQQPRPPTTSVAVPPTLDVAKPPRDKTVVVWVAIAAVALVGGSLWLWQSNRRKRY